MADEPTPVHRTIKLTVAYDGTDFVGWQRQAEGTSIQGLLEDRLSRIEGAPVTVIGAGRTDAGVHACGQVASARLTSGLDTTTLRRAVNATLPASVRILAVEDAEPGFHARYFARSKTYRYAILAGRLAWPFEWRYFWHIAIPLDVPAMLEAAALFEGEHDFAAFQSSGSGVATSRRTVFRSRLTTVTGAADPTTLCTPTADVATPWGQVRDVGGESRRLIYEVTATGFLRHMVRAMVGTLAEIGMGRRPIAALSAALQSGDRGKAGVTAPACGLCLVCVDYGSEAP